MRNRCFAVAVASCGICVVAPLNAQAPACAGRNSNVIAGYERAAADSPTAFLRQVELASCYDHAWQFQDVVPAIAKAVGILEGERASGQLKAPRADGRPVAGEGLPLPRRTRDALPDYPDKALSAGISGSVIVELVVDPKGNVREARVARSVPMLDQAALKGAQKWKYEPTLIAGKAVEVVTYGMVRFGLTAEPIPADWLALAVFHHEGGRPALARMALDAATMKAQDDRTRFGTYASNPAGAPDDTVDPVKIRDVTPVYPTGALRAIKQGVVTIEALVDTSGNVARAHIVGKPSVFDASALEAILQWKFKPATRNGLAVVVAATVTVNFRFLP